MVLRLDLKTGLALIVRAQEREREERYFQQWCAQLPFMDKDNFVSFSEYRDRLTGANIDLRPTAEILAELDAAEKELEEGGNADGDGDL